MSDESKVAELDLENLGKIRKKTDKLCNSSDTVIRKSLKKIYPHLEDLSSVLRTEEILSGNIPDKNVLLNRYKGYFFGGGRLLIQSDKLEIAQIFDIHFKNEEVKNVEYLSGNIAQQGMAKIC